MLKEQIQRVVAANPDYVANTPVIVELLFCYAPTSRKSGR